MALTRLYYFKGKDCEAFSCCSLPLSSISEYKRISGENNPKTNLKSIDSWKEILNIYILRIMCLLGISELTYTEYEKVSPRKIYDAQQRLVDIHGCVFVLSLFPEFLLDYYREDFWDAMIHRKNKRFNSCPIRQRITNS